jgi:hypothetical protein
MLSGLALALSGLPLELIARHGLGRRIHDRGGEKEVQFLFADAERLLPVWHERRLEVLRWGNRRGESQQLPCIAWTRLVVLLASGRADALSGRFLAVEWDVEELVRHGEALAGTDALTLRQVPPPSGG